VWRAKVSKATRLVRICRAVRLYISTCTTCQLVVQLYEYGCRPSATAVQLSTAVPSFTFHPPRGRYYAAVPIYVLIATSPVGSRSPNWKNSLRAA
jgi:hypothetical protein